MHSSALFWRAVLAFFALPATVAGLVPWLLLSPDRQLHMVGIPIVTVGIVLLFWCIRDFYVAGRGTLAPWAPPTRLVTGGLYRFSRNPMYLGVVLILCGWAVAFQTRPLWVYASGIALAFHARVVFYEEPWLARTHGPAWRVYRSRVARWLGRRTTTSAVTDREAAG